MTTVLAAGDRFIAAEHLAAEATAAFGPDTVVRQYQTAWPDDAAAFNSGVDAARANQPTGS